jgi:uncharacterized protein (TIGR00299 family) protein
MVFGYHRAMHIHLEPVGGIAGDMFVAALLDAWPDRHAAVDAALAAIDLPEGVAAGAVPFNDGILAGTRFLVAPPRRDAPHRAFRDICALIERARLPAGVARRAIAIFAVLAEAEGRVHGIAPAEVSFHEVGAWDSIMDIVAAAALIEDIGAAGWSTTPVPLGSGRVRSAHGDLPVPTPATALLLEGLEVFDDGRPGERVTPTGAAILRHLMPGQGLPRRRLRLGRVGHGFGTKRFAGISNVLRVAAFAEVALPGDASVPAAEEEIATLRFEVDDQTAEDLAIGLERLRAVPGVLDVLQIPGFGKKGRMLAQIQVLSRPDALDAAAQACLCETSTLGVRIERATRRVLKRDLATRVDEDGATVRVKTATRPGGALTAKAEMDDIAAASGDRAAREARRRRVEAGDGREDGG